MGFHEHSPSPTGPLLQPKLSVNTIILIVSLSWLLHSLQWYPWTSKYELVFSIVPSWRYIISQCHSWTVDCYLLHKISKHQVFTNLCWMIRGSIFLILFLHNRLLTSTQYPLCLKPAPNIFQSSCEGLASLQIRSLITNFETQKMQGFLEHSQRLSVSFYMEYLSLPSFFSCPFCQAKDYYSDLKQAQLWSKFTTDCIPKQSF